MLEARVGLAGLVEIQEATRARLVASADGHPATTLIDHLRAYSAIDDLVPFFGDYRLAYTEASLQLKNSVCLAYSGLYSQALTTLRSVVELSLLQAALPEGATAMHDDVNLVLPLGFGAGQNPVARAESQEQWASEGRRTPSWQSMLKRILQTDLGIQLDSGSQFSTRFTSTVESLNPYVHVRGYVKSATGIASSNALRFSDEGLKAFVTHFESVVQVSVIALLVAFLPSATSHPDAAAGFIEQGDFEFAVGVLPEQDAALFRRMYESIGLDGSA